MSEKLIDENEINSVMQSGINKDQDTADNKLSEGSSRNIFEELREDIIFKERRIEKSERRVNENYGYRGPARRLTIDRRK